MTSFIVAGSHGELTVDLITGNVLAYDNEGYDSEEYAEIEAIDVPELANQYGRIHDDAYFDILDCGFWTSAGQYEPPALDWRNDRGDGLPGGGARG